MTIQVVMPKIGLTMTEGKIVEWKKEEGERVEKGEILFVFETEKVTFDVEAPQSGYLAKILVQVDETVPVGELVGLLVEEKGEAVEATAAVPATVKEPEAAAAEAQQEVSKPEDERRAKKVRATPMAKRLAKERGLDLNSIAPSGKGGRIKMQDVDAAETAKPVEPASPQQADGKLVKLTGMRRIIAQKMMAGKTETAQTYMVISVDATGLMAAKEKLTPFVERIGGPRVTITDLVMKITASAIGFHPIMNTRWTEDGILWFDDIHMGMAMALKDGLIVPVIRNIGKKSLSETAKARAEIVEKGKLGRLTPDEMSGGTFTVSSLGMFGVEEFTAIINQPESAILAVGAILDKPLVVNKEIVVRPTMKITLSYDHRVIDGAKAAEFAKTLQELMENPILTVA